MTTIAVHVHAVLGPLTLPCARPNPFTWGIASPPRLHQRKKDTAEVSFFMVGGGEGSMDKSVKPAHEAHSTMTTTAVHVHAVLGPLTLPCARPNPFTWGIASPPCLHQRKKDTAEVSFFMVGGGEGSRTPVRK